jgi:hypothetical protein
MALPRKPLESGAVPESFDYEKLRELRIRVKELLERSRETISDSRQLVQRVRDRWQRQSAALTPKPKAKAAASRE